jgi:hypothetical protein
MCPVCITTAALIAAGAGSTGGLLAGIARRIRDKRTVVVTPHEPAVDQAVGARKTYEPGASP